MTTSRRAPARAYAILLGAQLAVGAAAIFARYALTGAQPLAVSALRLLVASGILLGIARLRTREHHALTKRENILLLFAGLALALHFAGWIWSLQFTSVAIATLLVCSSPIWTAVYDFVILQRSLSRLAWVGFSCGAVGLVLVLNSHSNRVPVPGHSYAGYLLALGGSVAIGAYLILVREVRSQLSTRSIITRTYGYAAVTLTVGALLTHQGAPNVTNTSAWLGILAMALLSQLLGHTSLNISLHFFSPSAISFSTLLEPVIAAILAAIIFQETLDVLALLGGCVVLASNAIVLYAEADWARN